MAQSALDKCDFYVARKLNHHATQLSVIVRFTKAPTAQQLHRLQELGLSVYRHLDLIHAVAGTVPARSIAKISALSFVAGISSDETVTKNDLFTVDNSFANVATQQYGVSGSGIGVAVVDTGVNSVDDLMVPGTGVGVATKLKSRVVASVNFSQDASALDTCGHGTHVAGIIAGDGLDSTGTGYYNTYLGIAPKANIINVKVLRGTGAGTVSNVIAGLSWCVTNKLLYNIRIINLSLGHPVGQSYTTDPLCQAVEAAWKSGIVVFCAAGNNGRLNANPTNGAPNSGYGTNYASVTCPGNDPYVITVGAMKQTDSNRADDQIASYSGRGPSMYDFVVKPDIVAPGNKIISTEDCNASYLVSSFGSQVDLPKSAYMTGNPTGVSQKYYVLSGTSMATPVAAGAAALMLQQQPLLSPDTIKARMMLSADKWTDPSGNGDICTYGAGYLNIPAAMSNTVITTTYAMSPTLGEDQNGNVFINLDSIFGSQNALWGTGINNLSSLYGQNALWGTGGVSDTNALWGTGGLTDSNALWGTWFWTNAATSNVSDDSLDLSSTSVILNGE
jgi:serine protease AprX